MADVQIRRKTEENRAGSVRSSFKAAVEALWPVWDGATQQQRNNVLSGLGSWDFGASQPSVTRENALYAGLVLLFLMVAHLWIKVLGRDG